MFTMRFEGGKELAAALLTLSPRVRKSTLIEVLKDAGEPMRVTMGRLAPDDPTTGSPDLHTSMTISTVTKVDGLRTDEFNAAVAVGPAKGQQHGILQEFGTSHHPAHPFARPAFDSDAPKALVIIGKGLWTALASRGIGQSVTVDAPVVGGPGGSTL